MSTPYYPQITTTPNLGLSLVGMDEVIAEDFVLIDAFAGAAGGSVQVNSSVVNNPNFNDTTPSSPAGYSNVIWQVSGGNISAYALTATNLRYPIAGLTPPSPLVSETELPSTISPDSFVQDTNGNWHSAAGVDITTSNFQRPNGVLTWGQKFYFRDTLAATQTFKNSLISINHLWDGETDYTTQDRGLSINSSSVTATIANFSIASNVVTYTLINPVSGFGATCGFRVGQRVRASGLSVGTYLNSVQLIIRTASSVVANLQTITASDSGFTHADVGTTTDSGSLDQVGYSLTCAQMELDLYGQPAGSGSPDSEFSCLSLQTYDTHIGNIGGPNQFGANVIRASYYLGSSSGSQTGWTVNPPSVIRSIFQANTTDGGGVIYRNLYAVAANLFGGANMSYYAAHLGVPNIRFGTANVGLYVDDFGTNASDFAIKVVGGRCSFGGDASIAGTLTAVGGWPSTVANLILAGPSSGAAANATFRLLVGADIPVMIGDSGSGGVQGGAPAPAAGDSAAGKFLKADGSWSVPPGAGGSVTWDAINSPISNLSLNCAGFTSTFNQTSAVIWTWKNTTAATSSVSQSSPVLTLSGNYWNSSASADDSWSIKTSVANGTNGTSTLTISHSGSTGVSSVGVPAGAPGTAAAWGLTFSGTTCGLAATGNVLGLITDASNHYPTFRLYRGNLITAALTTQVSSGTDYLNIATGQTNSRVQINGGVSTQAFSSVIINNGSAFTGTAAATQIGLLVGADGTFGNMTFSPSSGSGAFQCTKIQYTVNQTGTSSGSVTGLVVNAIETSLKGSVNLLLDLQAGVSGGTSMLNVDNKGTLTTAGGCIVNRQAKSGNYTTLKSDYVLTFTATATLTLDSAVATSGTTYRIKLSTAAAGGSTVTVSPNNSKTIEGAATLVLSTLGQAVDVVYDGTSNWEVF